MSYSIFCALFLLLLQACIATDINTSPIHSHETSSNHDESSNNVPPAESSSDYSSEHIDVSSDENTVPSSSSTEALPCPEFETQSSIQDENQSRTEWESLSTRQQIYVNIYDGDIRISSHPIIDSISVFLTEKNSVLLRDTSWVNLQTTPGNSLSGQPVFIRKKHDSPYPSSIVIRYRFDTDQFFIDTISIAETIAFNETVTFSQSATTAASFSNRVQWNIETLSASYTPYLTIAVDNGLEGAEYYESHPNYLNLPETPQPPEGKSTKYAHFKVQENAFEFISNQKLLPFLELNYIVKKCDAFDFLITDRIKR